MSFHDVESGYGGEGRFVSPQRNRLSSTPGDPSLAVHKNIEQLSVNVPQISKMLAKLGTSQDSNELRYSLRTLIGRTRDLIRETNQEIRQLSNGPEKNKMLQSKLAKDFQTWCQRFQDVSKLSAQKEREFPLLKNQSFSRGSGMTPFSLNTDNSQELEKTALLSDSRTQFVQIESDREFNEMQIAEREKGIKEIETAMLEVNEITRDLANLVTEQGRLVDNIESHINTTYIETQLGVEEIRAANEYDKRGRSKMCWIIVIITVAVIVALLIIILPIVISLSATAAKT